MEVIKWLVIILSPAPVHMSHALVMANAVNASLITAEAGRFPDASFPNPVRKPMIGL